MDWLNEIPSVTGIDRIVAEMAQKLMSGTVTFGSPYWNGDVVIETFNEYRAWVRTAERIWNEPGAERRALEIWKTEKNGKFEDG